MIVINTEFSRWKRPIRAVCGDSVEFQDNPQSFRRIGFSIKRNGHELLEISGSHAQDMLIAFLENATDRHLKAFRDGIDGELERRKNDTH